MSPDPSRYRGAPVPSAGNTKRGKGSEQREKKENQRDFVALHNSLQCGAVCPPTFQAIGQEGWIFGKDSPPKGWPSPGEV